MDLHAGRSFFGILGVDFVEAENLASRGVELVVVDLDRGQRGVERELNIGYPCRIPEGHECGVRHGCGGGACLDW
jgi:hypothetical protein